MDVEAFETMIKVTEVRDVTVSQDGPWSSKSAKTTAVTLEVDAAAWDGKLRTNTTNPIA